MLWSGKPSATSNYLVRLLILFTKVVVIMTSSSKSTLGKMQVPVNLTSYGGLLKVSIQDSNKYAGLINHPSLNTLLMNHSVELNATLMEASAKKDQVSEKTRGQNSITSQDCSVRITVFGLANERTVVGKLLSDAGLYLQHPWPSEHNGHVEYNNPHYLLRPGSKIPNLDQLSQHSDSAISKSTDCITETDKNRFMRILDLANEVGELPSIEPSHRLRSTLEE